MKILPTLRRIYPGWYQAKARVLCQLGAEVFCHAFLPGYSIDFTWIRSWYPLILKGLGFGPRKALTKIVVYNVGKIR